MAKLEESIKDYDDKQKQALVDFQKAKPGTKEYSHSWACFLAISNARNALYAVVLLEDDNDKKTFINELVTDLQAIEI